MADIEAIHTLEGTETIQTPIAGRDRLMEVIERSDGRPFPTTAGLIRQWATSRLRHRASSREHVYCAELVATTYQQMGLLPNRRPAGWQ